MNISELKTARFFFLVILGLFFSFSVYGKIPEPDNILYGSITIGNTLITSVDTGVVVSLKINDETITSYIMGENTKAQNYYVLTIPIDLYGEQEPGTARPGDMASIYVGNDLATTTTIGDRGSISQLHLNIGAIQCTSRNGTLLSASTYEEGEPCGQPYHDFIISTGYTVTWDGIGGPLTGKVTVQPGATFKITESNGVASEVILDGGTLDVDYNFSVGNLTANDGSDVNIASNAKLNVTSQLNVPASQTLTLSGTGTLNIDGTLNLAGLIVPGSGTIDLRGASLVLANDLNLTGVTVLTDETTNLQITSDVTITSDQALKVATLELNDNQLTLGSATTDLTVYNALTLDSAGEIINTGEADLTLMAALTLDQGSILSESGTIALNGGGTMTGGTLDISGSSLITSNSFEQSGGTITTDQSTQSSPFANAGEDQTVSIGDQVTLDGSSSNDIDGTIQSYAWTQTGGTTLTLTGATTSQLQFTAPSIVGSNEEFTFQLTVTDNQALTNSTTVKVYVVAAGTYLLTLDKLGDGSGAVLSDPAAMACDATCDYKYEAFGSGSVVRLEAQAEAGSIFVGWNIEGCTRHQICEVTMNQNVDTTAEFITPTILTQDHINNGTVSRLSGPYRVSSDLFLTSERSLTIEAGTDIYFDLNSRLSISGVLNMTGSAQSPIKLSASDPSQKWGGLVFTSNYDYQSNIKEVEFSYANSAIQLECCGTETSQMIWISDSLFQFNEIAISGYASYQVGVQDATFDSNTYGLSGTRRVNLNHVTLTNHQVALIGELGEVKYSTLSNNDLAVQNTLEGLNLSYNDITGNQVGVEIIDPSGGTISPSLVLSNNNITGNTQYNLRNTQSQDLSLPNNWWGSVDTGTIAASIYDNADDGSLGTVTTTPVLTEVADITPPAASGIVGDIDNDGQLTGGDTTRMGQCITHTQFVNDFGATPTQADEALGIVYQDDCTRITDLDGDSLQTGGDTTRLGQCITHTQFVDDFGATESEANTALGITYSTDCSIVISSY